MVTQDGYPTRRVNIHDLVRNALILCVAQVLQGNAPRGNLAMELSKAFVPKKRQGKGKASGELISADQETKSIKYTRRVRRVPLKER